MNRLAKTVRLLSPGFPRISRAFGSQTSVPVVDLSESDTKIAQSLRQACIDYGFFYVANHGITQAQMDGVLEGSRSFFRLPLEEKMKVIADKNHRGYTPLYEEMLDPAKQSIGDTKEGYYIGRHVSPDSPEASKPLHGPNQWPAESVLPGWKSTMSSYFDAVNGVSRVLLGAFGLSLNLPKEYFLRPGYFDRSMNLLRLLHYNQQKSQIDKGIFAGGAHTDFGMMTLLLCDKEPGLEILPRNTKDWIPVGPIPGMLIVNLGDMLQQWTNDLYTSTPHRVINRHGNERTSVPFFVQSNMECVVECLPGCSSPTNPPKYKTTTGGDYLVYKYEETQTSYKKDAK